MISGEGAFSDPRRIQSRVACRAVSCVQQQLEESFLVFPPPPPLHPLLPRLHLHTPRNPKDDRQTYPTFVCFHKIVRFQNKNNYHIIVLK